MMTDTQTAFVLVPREPEAEMLTAALRSVSGVKMTDPFGYDADPETVLRLAIRSALSAAPKPPESEFGPVANYLLGDAHRRIEADRAIIAALRAENERLRKDMSDWREGDLQGVVDHMHAFKDHAEAAEARVKELEDALEPFAEFIGEGVFWDDGCPDDYVFLIHDGLVMRAGWIRRARAALASKTATDTDREAEIQQRNRDEDALRDSIEGERDV
jgi:plasmid stabilization system protein ParE